MSLKFPLDCNKHPIVVGFIHFTYMWSLITAKKCNSQQNVKQMSSSDKENQLYNNYTFSVQQCSENDFTLWKVINYAFCEF